MTAVTALEDIFKQLNQVNYSWASRPYNNEGVQIEEGDQVLLACRLSTTQEKSDQCGPLIGARVGTYFGFIGCETSNGDRHAKWFEVTGTRNDLLQQEKALVSTVKKHPTEQFYLEAEIDGQVLPMLDWRGLVFFQKFHETFDADICAKVSSLGFKHTEEGYEMHFLGRNVRDAPVAPANLNFLVASAGEKSEASIGTARFALVKDVKSG